MSNATFPHRREFSRGSQRRASRENSVTARILAYGGHSRPDGGHLAPQAHSLVYNPLRAHRRVAVGRTIRRAQVSFNPPQDTIYDLKTSRMGQRPRAQERKSSPGVDNLPRHRLQPFEQGGDLASLEHILPHRLEQIRHGLEVRRT